jgi:hypothetical protein
MKPLPHTAELEIVARHIEQAPPGIFDPRSWAYWNLKIGRYPAPPLPQRSFSAPPL